MKSYIVNLKNNDIIVETMLKSWCFYNCKGRYKITQDKFILYKQHDAVLFRMSALNSRLALA